MCYNLDVSNSRLETMAGSKISFGMQYALIFKIDAASTKPFIFLKAHIFIITVAYMHVMHSDPSHPTSYQLFFLVHPFFSTNLFPKFSVFVCDPLSLTRAICVTMGSELSIGACWDHHWRPQLSVSQWLSVTNSSAIRMEYLNPSIIYD